MSDLRKIAGNAAGKAAGKVKETCQEMTPESVIRQAVKLPGIRISREKYLKRELSKYCPDKAVGEAVQKSPAAAGIYRETIDRLADQAIDRELKKVTALSFANGIPGGAAMAVTVPADVIQYFGSMLRIMQKLAYLYGFEDFDLKQAEISDAAMKEMLVLLGVMSGLRGSDTAVCMIADARAQKLSGRMVTGMVRKNAYDNLVKKTEKSLRIRMAGQAVTDSVSKAVPLAGSVLSGGFTYLSFKPCARKLQKKLRELKTADPGYFR